MNFGFEIIESKNILGLQKFMLNKIGVAESSGHPPDTFQTPFPQLPDNLRTLPLQLVAVQALDWQQY